MDNRFVMLRTHLQVARNTHVNDQCYSVAPTDSCANSLGLDAHDSCVQPNSSINGEASAFGPDEGVKNDIDYKF